MMQRDKTLLKPANDKQEGWGENLEAFRCDSHPQGPHRELGQGQFRLREQCEGQSGKPGRDTRPRDKPQRGPLLPVSLVTGVGVGRGK